MRYDEHFFREILTFLSLALIVRYLVRSIRQKNHKYLLGNVNNISNEHMKPADVFGYMFDFKSFLRRAEEEQDRETMNNCQEETKAKGAKNILDL